MQEFIAQSLHGAAIIAKEHFGTVSSKVKPEDSNQVLTEADIAIGKFLLHAVEQAYPGYNIIDEEAGVIDKGSNYTFVVDPIDGTSNFAAGLPHFGVMLGLLQDNRPIAGGIVLPMFDKLYVAQQGLGAYCNGQRVAVAAAISVKDCLVAYGIDGHRHNPAQTRQEMQVLADIILGIRNLRTSNSAYDIAMVASGEYGAFLNQTTKIWDNVAPQIIIEEAGGLFTDFYGSPMNYSDALKRTGDNFTVCAAAPQLHRELQTIIHHSNK